MKKLMVILISVLLFGCGPSAEDVALSVYRINSHWDNLPSYVTAEHNILAMKSKDRQTLNGSFFFLSGHIEGKTENNIKFCYIEKDNIARIIEFPMIRVSFAISDSLKNPKVDFGLVMKVWDNKYDNSDGIFGHNIEYLFGYRNYWIRNSYYHSLIDTIDLYQSNYNEFVNRFGTEITIYTRSEWLPNEMSLEL